MRESVRAIRAALARKGYKPIRSIETRNSTKADILTWYSRVDATSSRIVLLQEYDGGTCGCELFIQATTSNSVEKTIEAIP